MRTITSVGRWALLLSGVITTSTLAGPLDEEPAKTAEPIEARLTFAKPWFTHQGITVKMVTVGADGQKWATCNVGDRDKSDVCGKPMPLEPGAHVVTVSISAGGFSEGITFWDRLVVAPREEVVLDMAKALKLDEAEKAVTRKVRPGKNPVACLAELEGAAYAPACTGDDLKNAVARLESAWATCQKQEQWTDDQKLDARTLLNFASNNWFSTPIDQCYHRSIVEHLGSMITSYRPNGFPPKTVESGSWTWARSGFNAEEVSSKSLSVHEKALVDAAKASVERVAMVGAVIDALGNKKLGPVRDAVIAGRYSLDPKTVEGHRLWLLLSTGEEDPALAEWLAKNVKTDKALHCGLYDEQDRVVLALVHPKLTRAGFEAVVAMAQRTPSDDGLNRCAHVGGANIESDVPALERLTWLVNFDCSDKRAAGKRGDEVSSFFDPENTNLASLEDQKRLKPVFDRCKPK